MAEEEQTEKVEMSAESATQSAQTVEELQQKLSALQQQLHVVNRESAERRHKLEAYERQEVERQQAELSETEKLRKQLSDAQTALEQMNSKVREQAINSAIANAAAALGFTDPEDALALINRSDLVLGDDGTPTNADAVLKTLAEKKPYMIRKTAPQTLSVTNPGARSQAGETDEQRRKRLFG